MCTPRPLRSSSRIGPEQQAEDRPAAPCWRGSPPTTCRPGRGRCARPGIPSPARRRTRPAPSRAAARTRSPTPRPGGPAAPPGPGGCRTRPAGGPGSSRRGSSATTSRNRPQPSIAPAITPAVTSHVRARRPRSPARRPAAPAGQRLAATAPACRTGSAGAARGTPRRRSRPPRRARPGRAAVVRLDVVGVEQGQRQRDHRRPPASRSARCAGSTGARPRSGGACPSPRGPPGTARPSRSRRPGPRSRALRISAATIRSAPGSSRSSANRSSASGSGIRVCSRSISSASGCCSDRRRRP